MPTLQDGYQPELGSPFGCSDLTTPFLGCNAVCAAGFWGTVSYECHGNGMPLVVTGCARITCHTPETQEGYDLSDVTCFNTSFGNVNCTSGSCAVGYFGDPKPTCLKPEALVFTGCKACDEGCASCEGEGLALSPGNCSKCAPHWGDNNGADVGGECDQVCDSDYFDNSSSATEIECLVDAGMAHGTVNVSYTMMGPCVVNHTLESEVQEAVCAGIVNTTGRELATCTILGDFISGNCEEFQGYLDFNFANLTRSLASSDEWGLIVSALARFGTPATEDLPVGVATVLLGRPQFVETCRTSSVQCAPGSFNAGSSRHCSEDCHVCCHPLGEGCSALRPDGSCRTCVPNAEPHEDGCVCSVGFFDTNSNSTNLTCQAIGSGCKSLAANGKCNRCTDPNAEVDGHACVCKPHYQDYDEDVNNLQCDVARQSVRGQVVVHVNVSQCPQSQSLDNFKLAAGKVVIQTLKMVAGLSDVQLLGDVSSTCTPIHTRRVVTSHNLTLTVGFNATGFPNATGALIGASITILPYKDIPFQLAIVQPAPSGKPKSVETNPERNGKIAGAVIGSVLGFVLLILIPIYICFIRKKEPPSGGNKQPSGGNDVEMERDVEHREDDDVEHRSGPAEKQDDFNV